ncbi:hypothetical protein V1969_32570, partial [Pseudomonas aeruginosa]
MHGTAERPHPAAPAHGGPGGTPTARTRDAGAGRRRKAERRNGARARREAPALRYRGFRAECDAQVEGADDGLDR